MPTGTVVIAVPPASAQNESPNIGLGALGDTIHRLLIVPFPGRSPTESRRLDLQLRPSPTPLNSRHSPIDRVRAVVRTHQRIVYQPGRVSFALIVDAERQSNNSSL